MGGLWGDLGVSEWLEGSEQRRKVGGSVYEAGADHAMPCKAG